MFAALIPIAIGFGSYWIHQSISKESLAKDYVGIAVSILEKPNDKEHDALRDWAVDLLTKESKPILELKLQQQEELRSSGFGSEELARIEGGLGPDEYFERSLSPDGKKAALLRMAHHKAYAFNIVRVYDLQTEREIAAFDAGEGTGPKFAWSGDSTKLLVGWTYPSRVVAFDLAQPPPVGGDPRHPSVGNLVGEYRTKSTSGEIGSLSFSQNGRSIIINTTDGKSEVWQLP